MKKVEKTIESIGFTTEELLPFLMSEIEEFLKAKYPQDQIEEFHDIIFALKSIAYSHTGNHLKIDISICEKKIENRLKKYGTISKKQPILKDCHIKDIIVGVVHISFGNFKQPWSNVDPLKNGTEAEIAMLTDNEFERKGEYTNHVIITFDDVEELTYSLLTSNVNKYEKNTILCRIPDFIYKKAKDKKDFIGVEHLLSLQVVAALSNLRLKENCIFHFHSWESALAIYSDQFKELVKGHKKIFSPYLTVSRLKEFLKNNEIFESTLDKEELEFSSHYERLLVSFCDKTIVESEKDRKFYKEIGGDKVQTYSYSDSKRYIVPANPIINSKLEFIAGGRPVYEKGFLELVREVPEIINYVKMYKLDFRLKIFCKDYDRVTHKLKKSRYIKKLEELVNRLNLSKYVSLLDKVPIGKLRKEIRNSCGLIVPSLYDPYCLMPHYAISENKVSFVSKYAGISESIISDEYIFDPLERGSLLNAIKKWITDRKDFVLNITNPSYRNLYLE